MSCLLFKNGLLVLTILIFSIRTMTEKLYICDFEVFGIVQGVFFRKHTKTEAKSLNLRGWCMNTNENTVKGQLEGPNNDIKKMQNWLEKKGSPQSRIDKAEFSELKEISGYSFADFSIKE